MVALGRFSRQRDRIAISDRVLEVYGYLTMFIQGINREGEVLYRELSGDYHISRVDHER